MPPKTWKNFARGWRPTNCAQNIKLKTNWEHKQHNFWRNKKQMVAERNGMTTGVCTNASTNLVSHSWNTMLSWLHKLAAEYEGSDKFHDFVVFAAVPILFISTHPTWRLCSQSSALLEHGNALQNHKDNLQGQPKASLLQYEKTTSFQTKSSYEEKSTWFQFWLDIPEFSSVSEWRKKNKGNGSALHKFTSLHLSG